LALGNAVVLKPDPRTPVAGGFVLARVFEEAGLPPGLLHVLPGGADVGSALVTDRNVRVISFTGSTAVGRKVATLGAEHLKRVHLELGGNSALVVLDDVDVDQVVSAGAWGSFLHQGQICMTTGRHIVHERIADDYVAALAEHADNLPVGDPATEQVALGPVIDEKQRDKIHGLVTATVAAGARLAAGGRHDRLFYRPTVLDQVRGDMPAYAEEVFGPVAPVIRFSTTEEAVRLAADTDYGLSLGILTRDAMRGLELADQIPTGIVHIHDQTVNDGACAAFGGVLHSATGARFGGQASMDGCADQRWMTARGQAATYPFWCVPRSASSGRVPPGWCWRSCCTGGASPRWCWSGRPASTWSGGSGPACWSTARWSCCAGWGSPTGSTARACSTTAWRCCSTGSATAST